MPIRHIVAALTLFACADAALARELLVTSFFNDSIVRFDADTGEQLGSFGDRPTVVRPLATRVGPDGLLYVASELNRRIVRYDPKTFELVDVFINATASVLDSPTGMTWDANGDIYVASFSGNKVVKFNGKTGEFIGNFVTPGSGGLSGADNGIIFGPDGDLYVPSYNNNRVLRYDGDTGAFIDTFIPNTLINRPRVLVFNDNNELFITSEGFDSVRRYNATTGELIGNFTTPGAGGLDTPVGMVFDDEYLYVSSSTTNDVYRFNALTGAFVDVFIDGDANGLNGPVFLTILPDIPAPGTGAVALLGIAALARRRR
jgi:uncharacterized protein (TIGR03382 family)